MVTVRSSFKEKLDWIVSGETLEEQVMRARQVAQMDATFPAILRMSCIDAERLVGLPEGMPDTIKVEDDLPDGISDSSIRQEIRRIRGFQRNTPMQLLSATKREHQWIQILESIHWKEQQILTLIKDWRLFETYPVLFDIMEALGAKVDVQRSVPDLPKETTVEAVPTVSTNTEIQNEPSKRGRKKKTGETE